MSSVAMTPRRKLIGFDPETLHAVDLLARDTGKSLQELVDEAFDRFAAQAPPPAWAERSSEAKRKKRACQREPSTKASQLLEASEAVVSPDRERYICNCQNPIPDWCRN